MLWKAAAVWLPDSYAGRGEHEEYWALRERAAIMDLSARSASSRSPGRTPRRCCNGSFSREVSTDWPSANPGYGCLLTDARRHLRRWIGLPAGRERRYRYVGNGEKDGDWLRRQAAERNLGCPGEVIVRLVAQSGRSGAAGAWRFCGLWSLCDLDALGYFRFVSATVGDTPCVISRTGYTGERGYELFVHPCRRPGTVGRALGGRPALRDAASGAEGAGPGAHRGGSAVAGP